MIEKLFRLKDNNTNVRTEVLAGITTFMTMAYILAVNPDLLSVSGMDKQAQRAHSQPRNQHSHCNCRRS